MLMAPRLCFKAAAAGLLLGAVALRRRLTKREEVGGEEDRKVRPRDLVVVLERCIDPRNFEYILRTCLALQVEDVWVIDATERKIASGNNPFDRSSLAEFQGDPQAAGSGAKKSVKVGGTLVSKTDPVTLLLDGNAGVLLDKLRVTHFASSGDFLLESERRGCHVWATELSQKAVPLAHAMASRTKQQQEQQQAHQAPIALVFGREGDGVSEEVLQASRERVYFPLHGFSDSLNVSASVAIILDSLLS